MADSKKAEKLATARKMLAQYQKRKEISPRTSPRNVCSQNNFSNENVNQSLSIDSNQKDILNGNNAGVPNISNGNTNENPQNNVCSFFNFNVQNKPLEAGLSFFDSLDENCQIQGEQLGSNDVVDYRLPLNIQSDNTIPTVDTTQEDNASNLQLKCKDLESTLIQEQNKNAELQSHLRQSTERVSQLERDLKNIKDDSVGKHNEVSQLEEKLKIQTRTIEILVTEKSELQHSIDNMQEEADKRKAEREELTSRLSMSRGNVARLEKEIKDLSEARLQHSTMLRKLESSLDEANATAYKYRSNLEENEVELKELKKRLEGSGQETLGLRGQLKAAQDQLSMAQIRLQQLGINGGEVEAKREDNNEVVEELKKRLDDLIREKDQNSHEYQEYLGQLSSQVEETNVKYEELLLERDQLKVREESLVAHIAEFEKQVQKEAAIEKRSTESSRCEEENQIITQMREELDITLQRIAELEESLEIKEEKIAEVKAEGERWCEEAKELEKRLETCVPDAKLLQAAMESDKLAASRAIDQNNALKKQLEDMHKAFTTLSEGKLELMEELEKEQSMSAHLRKQLALHQHPTKEETTQIGEGIILVDGCSQTTYHDLENIHQQHPPVTVEAMVMLEEKFRKTMDHLAQLSDEKQRLEHLVTQLQGETETIGEYIALYQAQRSVLERRAVEREQQVNSICKEKEALRNKLDTLSQIVPTLLPKEGNEEIVGKVISLIGEIGTSSLVQHHPNINFHPCPCCSGKLLTV